MKFNELAVTSRSFTIELDNKDVYNTLPFNFYINGVLYKENVTTNVVSAFGLEPNKEYSVEIAQNGISFIKTIKTKTESVWLNVKRFGAKGDGVTIDTNALQATILSCPDNGTVHIPAGDYYTGPLFLRSNITIELAKGARLVGDTDRTHYPILPGETYTTDEKDEYNLGSWEGNPLSCFASIITGVNVSNVNIIGEGTIDGNAQNGDWWIDVRKKRIAWRPRGLFLNHCSNVMLQGVKVCNTPSWNLHPYFSDNLKFIDLTLENPKNSPNTDGCDPESCKNVDIIGVYFSVGDDCIAIKAGKIYTGRKYKKPSEAFNIRNCSMNFGHGAIVLGSEMSGGIKDITVSQCLFNQTDRGLRIKTRRGRGKDAIIDGITFENIKMNKVLTPLVMNMFYYCDPDGHTEYVYSKEKLPVDDRTPYLGEFHFKNIECKNVNAAAGVFFGLPEQSIKSINIENVSFSYDENPQAYQTAMMDGLEKMAGRGLVFSYVDEVVLNNVTFDGLNNQKYELSSVSSFKEI